MVVGFVPSWRWAMPKECDVYNARVRSILSALGIMTWDAELLQSLLLPYVNRNPKNGNLNHYHVRLPEDQEYDLGWVWDRVLRGMLRAMHAAVLGDDRDYSWPAPLEIPLITIGPFFTGNPIAPLTSARDWPLPPGTSVSQPALRVGTGVGKAKSRDDSPPGWSYNYLARGGDTVSKDASQVVNVSQPTSQVGVHRDARGSNAAWMPTLWVQGDASSKPGTASGAPTGTPPAANTALLHTTAGPSAPAVRFDSGIATSTTTAPSVFSFGTAATSVDFAPDTAGKSWHAWAVEYDSKLAAAAAAASATPSATPAVISPAAALTKDAPATSPAASVKVVFSPFKTYWDDDLDIPPPPPSCDPPDHRVTTSSAALQSPKWPPPTYTPQQQVVTPWLPADTPVTLATALSNPSTSAPFLEPLPCPDILHKGITEQAKPAPTPVDADPTQPTARQLRRFQRAPATVAWDRVVTICRHRRRWDEDPEYRNKNAREGSYRGLPGQGLVHGGPWVPRSARDDPIARGRAVDLDAKSVDHSKAADLMESWPARTAPITATVQADRTAAIWKIVGVHYTGVGADDVVRSPALQVAATEATSAGDGSAKTLLLPPPRSRTHSRNKIATEKERTHGHHLPIVPLHHDATSISSAQSSTSHHPQAAAPSGEVSHQAPGAATAAADAAADLWTAAWKLDAPPPQQQQPIVASASCWSDNEWAAWYANWSGWPKTPAVAKDATLAIAISTC